MKMLIDIDESVYMGITHRQKIRITDMCKACTAIMKGTIIAIEPKESKAKNKDCSTCIYCRDGFCGDEACAGCFEDPEHANYEPRERELIDKYNLLAAIKTYDNFGFVEPNCFVRNPTGNVVAYIRYNDVIKCIKCQKGIDENDDIAKKTINKLPSVTLQPKAGYISIDDVMSVFDDYMRGDVNGDDRDTFLKMLKDKAESEDKDVT